MNAISVFFKLAARQGEIRRFFALYNQIKTPLSELIDIGRRLLTDVGALDQPEEDSPLARYGTRWVQESLNELMDAKLTVDGELRESTIEAVKKFQAAHPPLKVDGSPGVQTAAVIAAELDKRRS